MVSVRRPREIRPNFPIIAARLADQRDSLRASQPDNPRIKLLSYEIKKLVNDHNRRKWRAHLDKCNLNSGTRSLWHTIKQLSNPTRRQRGIVINFKGNPVPDGKKCANEFNRQFTPHPPQMDKTVRNTLRRIHNLKEESLGEFMNDQPAAAIRATRTSKALGPDRMSSVMLKYIRPNGIDFLTSTLNLSLSSLGIPSLWKVGRVIPLIKPNKP